MEWDDGLALETCMEDPIDEKTRDAFHAIAIAAQQMEEEIADCHNVVSCPKCGATVGERCVRVYGPQVVPPADPKPLKHAHRERWTRVVPDR